MCACLCEVMARFGFLAIIVSRSFVLGDGRGIRLLAISRFI